MNSLGILSRPPQLAELEEGQSVVVLVQPQTLGDGAPVAVQYRVYRRTGGKLLSHVVKDMSDVDFAEVFPSTVTVSVIPEGTADYDKFLVSDGGTITYRTAAQMLADLGLGTGVEGDHIHDTRYYTETELDAGQLDNRYYTESEIDAMSLVDYTGTPVAAQVAYYADVNTIQGAADFTFDGSTLYLPNMPAGVDNSVVVLDADGKIRTDEIDSRVWGSSLVDYAGTPANNQIPTFTDANTIQGESHLTFIGSSLQFRRIDDSEHNITLRKVTLDATHPLWAISHRSDNEDLWLYTYNGAAFKNFIKFDYGNAYSSFMAGNIGVGTLAPGYLLTLADAGDAGSVTFSSGWAGTGWELGHISGDMYSLELESMRIRGSLSVYELIINQIHSVDGGMIISAGHGTVASTSGAAPGETVVLEDPSGNNASSFKKGDIVMIQRIGIDSIEVVKKIVRQVKETYVSGLTIPLEATAGAPADGGAIAAGDILVVLGNIEGGDGTTGRDSQIFLTAMDSNHPYIRIYDGIHTYAEWTGQTKVAAAMGNLNGAYGYAAETYGFAAGDPAGPNVTVDPTNGIRLRATTTTLAQLTGTSFTIKSANTGQRIEISGPGGSLIFYDADGEVVRIDDSVYGALPGIRVIDGVYLITDGTHGQALLHTANSRGRLSLLYESVAYFDVYQTGADVTEFVVKDLPSATGTDLIINANDEICKKTSSKRFKENIHPLEPDSALLYLTEPMSFNWKGSGLASHYFIAEDMAAIHKDLAHYNSEGQPESVNNEMLMAMTIAELKKLRQDVDQLIAAQEA